MDGLTVVLTYRKVRFSRQSHAETGRVGKLLQIMPECLRTFRCTIPYTGELVLRGEAVISYEDFEKINEEIEDVDAKYKNPRNLCSGSVRQLNNEITARRHVQFFAFCPGACGGCGF